jgi:hypothetical protein
MAEDAGVNPMRDKAASEALFREGKTLMKRRLYAEACVKFVESDRLGPGIGVLLNLADCQEKTGKTASAWATFVQSAERARAARDEDREKFAIARANALEPTLARLTISVDPHDVLAEMELRRDGRILGKGEWGASAPVDPGEHLVEAVAPGKHKYAAIVVVNEASSQTVKVEMVPESPRPNEPGSGNDSGVTVTSLESTRRGGGLGTQRVVALASAGLGVTGLAIGSALGLASKANRDEAAAHCVGAICDAAGVDARDTAKAQGNWSTAAFIVGAASLVGAGVLWFTYSPPTGHSQIGAGPGGLFVRGEWQ